MFSRTSAINKVLRLRIVFIPKFNFCSKKEGKFMPIPEPSSIVAPKVVAKHPPIEELTKGRKFKVSPEKVSDIAISNENLTRTTAKGNDKQDMSALSNKQTNSTNDTTEERLVSSSSGKPSSGGSSPITPVPRLERQEPGQVIFCLFPINWLKAFNNKTGVTGFWTFVFTYGTYLLSKEKIVMEHEYYGALSMIVLCWLSVIYVGPSIALGLDKEIDELENGFNTQRVEEKQEIEDDIAHEKNLQLSSAEQLVLVEAKRENVHLQQEAEYRNRVMTVHKRVVEIMEYQIAYDLIERTFAQKQMVRWVLDKVESAITDEVDSQYVDKCLDDMNELLKAEAKA